MALFTLLAGLTFPAPVPLEELPRVELEARTLPTGGGVEIEAERGRLFVPENREDPESRTIELAFALLRSRADEPLAPIVYLAGGPGGSSTQQVRSPEALRSWLPLLERHDVILLDQRGTGNSVPNLRFDGAGRPPEDVFVSREATMSYAKDIAGACVAHFRAKGVDVSGYTTVESADDLEDLRVTLGYERLNLLGFSYGTHLGLATMRRYPASLDSVVLIGTEGPNDTRKLPSTFDRQIAKVSALIARDPAVGRDVPDFKGLLARVLKDLERDPLPVPIVDPRSGEVVELPLGPFGLQLILRLDLGDRNDLPVFPRLLKSIEARDPRLVAWFMRKRLGIFNGLSVMFLICDSASGATADRLARIDREQKTSLLGATTNFPFPDVDAATDPPDLGDEFRAPFTSDVRTLFFSGTLDSQTPPYQAEEIRFGMSDAGHVIVENAGHEDMLPRADVQDAIRRFFGGEDVSDVRVALPPLRFMPLEGSAPGLSHPAVEELRD